MTLPSPEQIAKLPPDGGEEFNRLVFEESPYLLQHARNPVDWYPWGDEAFDRARAQDKPVFLSIGYSTCHWCHVMEHESFEDETVAGLLNESFVCVKLDREERPDLDHVFMSVTQGVTGSGGWPNTLLLTPEGKPFFAATYIAKETRFGRKGMLELVPELARAWREQKDELLRSANQIALYVSKETGNAPGGELGAATLALAEERLTARFEPRHGGFSRRPKFPVPHNLLFLLQRHTRSGQAELLSMVEKTLEQMRRGGIYDHLGFGFHRYSTDSVWLLPHFEKMLYDQALLAMAYTAAWQVTGRDGYRRTVSEIFTYVERDMLSPEGGFYSAEDADSEGEEGLFYIWDEGEIVRLLGESEARLFNRVYGVRPQGNFKDEASGEAVGKNILHLPRALEQVAGEEGLELSALEERLERSRRILFEHREGRVRPLRDDKILTDWNGLMIAAYARAGAAMGAEAYLRSARRAADFVLERLTDGNGRLLKRYRNGSAGLPATLEDYAFFVWGLVELYEATFETPYLEQAVRLTELMITHYWDEQEGAFFLAADDGEATFVRAKEIYDGALPSGNSVACLVLLRLGRLTGRSELEELASRTMTAFSGRVAPSPDAYPLLGLALDFAVGPTHEIVVAGSPDWPDTQEALRELQKPFLPRKVLLLRPEGESPPICGLAPFTSPQEAQDGRATFYLCRDFACELPTQELDGILATLKGEGRRGNQRPGQDD